jgi:hypothetical protein
MANKKTYFVIIGNDIKNVRLIGPFNRKIQAENYCRKNLEHAFFNPFKEDVGIMLVHNPKTYLKTASDLFENVLKNRNVIDFKSYRKKRK